MEVRAFMLYNIMKQKHNPKQVLRHHKYNNVNSLFKWLLNKMLTYFCLFNLGAV